MQKKARELAELIAAAGRFAANSQRSAHAAVSLVSAVVQTAALSAASTDDPEGDAADRHEEFRLDRLLDAVQEIISDQPDFDAQCEQILEEAMEAARRGDARAAAKRYGDYTRCLLRPRPVRLVE